MHRNDELFVNKHNLIVTSSNYSIILKEMDLVSFPLIEDFEMELFSRKTEFGPHLRFISKTQGILADFPWWDNVDKMIIRSEDFISLGDINSPFNGIEQGWQILIWEDGDSVYVMQGDEPCCTVFPIWFKIEKSKYLDQWQRIRNLV